MRWLTFVWLPLACCGSDEAVWEPISILDPRALVPVAVEQDPLFAHRPLDVDCPPAAWGPEGGGFEIKTGVCNYAAFAQPLPIDVEPGDRLHVVIWHDFLDSAEPGSGHAALWIDSQVLWEAVVQIPAASASLEAWVSVTQFAPAGTPLGFHLHNHGFNSWRLMVVEQHR